MASVIFRSIPSKTDNRRFKAEYSPAGKGLKPVNSKRTVGKEQLTPRKGKPGVWPMGEDNRRA